MQKFTIVKYSKTSSLHMGFTRDDEFASFEQKWGRHFSCTYFKNNKKDLTLFESEKNAAN